MKSTILFSAIASCILLFTACQEAPPPPAAAEAAAPAPAKPDLAQLRMEIQTVENAWADALNAKDMNAFMALYADDAVSMPNNAPTLTGKAAIQKSQEQEFATMPAGSTFSFETMDVFGDGNVVTEVGTTTIKDASGKISRTGKYFAVFEKRDGKYLCIREIYNSDKKE